MARFNLLFAGTNADIAGACDKILKRSFRDCYFFELETQEEVQRLLRKINIDLLITEGSFPEKSLQKFKKDFPALRIIIISISTPIEKEEKGITRIGRLEMKEKLKEYFKGLKKELSEIPVSPSKENPTIPSFSDYSPLVGGN